MRGCECRDHGVGSTDHLITGTDPMIMIALGTSNHGPVPVIVCLLDRRIIIVKCFDFHARFRHFCVYHGKKVYQRNQMVMKLF